MLLLLKILLGKILKVSLGESGTNSDHDLSLRLLDNNVVTKVTGLTVNLNMLDKVLVLYRKGISNEQTANQTKHTKFSISRILSLTGRVQSME